ncbi:unnamed protein product [marine sediment metagenome]|uniref:Uncharacterized protein n=1 Tax=marine sediment metagenome TaxID=412755 RepID=X1TZU9_9ZZZZ
MDIILVGIIVGILLNLVLLKAILELSRQITEELQELDGTLAQAIAKVVENLGIGDFEPVNPIQAALAQLMTSKIQGIKDQQAPIEINRSDNGFFAKKQ